MQCVGVRAHAHGCVHAYECVCVCCNAETIPFLLHGQVSVWPAYGQVSDSQHMCQFIMITLSKEEVTTYRTFERSTRRNNIYSEEEHDEERSCKRDNIQNKKP